MVKITITFSKGECLEMKRQKASHKKILVRGHFRNIRGKKIYVKSHYRLEKRK